MSATPADTTPSGIAVLAEDEPTWDDGPFPVRGVALPEEIVTHGDNTEGVATYWPASTVQEAAPLFEGAKIVDGSEHDAATAMENPQPAPETIIGEITSVEYEPGVGVLYEGEVDDPELAKRIDRNRVEVSPTLFRALGDEADDQDAMVAEAVKAVRDLSIVAEGAAQGNSIEPATAAMSALSATALEARFDGQTGAAALQEIHEPEFSETSTGEWSAPNLEDFGDDPDLGAVADHFLVSLDGFPPEDFGDLALPVVDTGGALNLSALQNAKARAGQVSGLSGDDLDRAESMIDRLANENFDEADFGAEADGATPGDDGQTGQSTDGPEPDDGTTTTDIMSDENDLTDAERELLATVDDPAEAIEVLQEYDGREEPAIVEQRDVDRRQSHIEALEDLMDERLTEDVGLKPATVEAMGFDAKLGEFEDEDGEFAPETLVQDPEAGSADSGAGGDDGPTDEDLDRIAEIDRKLGTVGSALPTSRVEALREEAADLAGTDDYESAVEVL